MVSNRGWPMRVLGVVVLVLWPPGMGHAAPEPPPPGDYPGAQYIDRTGCVFLRDGADWMPRLDPQGQPVCGFPPSKPAEGAAAPAAPPTPEEVLTATLAEGLKPGDLATDAPARPPRDAAPDPDQAVLTRTLMREAALDRRLREVTAPAAPADLCARLGYRPVADAAIPAGGDVTRGLCPGMAADPGPAFSVAARSMPDRAAGPVTDIAPGRDDPSPSETRQKPAPTRSAHRTPPETSLHPGSVVARRATPDRSAPTATVEMIPAHARYVQIGVYADDGNALAALRGLSALGYRTAQRAERIGDRTARAVMAGPFADRQALVRALTRLRSNGHPRAVAR